MNRTLIILHVRSFSPLWTTFISIEWRRISQRSDKPDARLNYSRDRTVKEEKQNKKEQKSDRKWVIGDIGILKGGKKEKKNITFQIR